MKELEYLKLLAKEYHSIGEVTTEFINLKAILNLSKGAEHFHTDIHGEYEAFSHPNVILTLCHTKKSAFNAHILQRIGTILP